MEAHRRADSQLPIEPPNTILDIDSALAARSIHERAELINSAVVSRGKLEHRLDAIQWEPAEVGEHALDELPPSHAQHQQKKRSKDRGHTPSNTLSSVPPVAAAH